MDVVEGLRMSWRSIRDHKLRSALTTLGVIIGIAAVIAFVTLGASLQADIIQTLAGEDTNVMYVSAGSGTGQGIPRVSNGGQPVFTKHDVNHIQGIRGVDEAVPVSGLVARTISTENQTIGRQWVTVTSPAYFEVKGDSFAAGRPFRMNQREVVLNEPAANLFSPNASVGDTVTVVKAGGGVAINATVVGIVEAPDGENMGLLNARNPAIYVPPAPFYEQTAYSPAAETNQRVYKQVIVSATSAEQVEAVQGRIYAYLTQRSDARMIKAEGYRFEVTTHEQLVDQIRQISSTFTAYITGIAVISLIVGAIGIANIMLVSVTERTKEIGIMKAIGARRRDVLQLFLFEAILLGLFGAFIGAVAGIGGAFAATEYIGLPLRFRVEWFVASIFVGLGVGVLSGLYPAWNASKTDPIDALRYE